MTGEARYDSNMRFRYWFGLFLSFAFGVLAYTSQVGPDDALSNLSKWFTFATTLASPSWLRNPETDFWGTILFSVAAIVSFFWLVWPYRNKVIEWHPGRWIRNSWLWIGARLGIRHSQGDTLRATGTVGPPAPIVLREDAVGAFVILLTSANNLISESTTPNLDVREWQSRVVEWFQLAESIVQRELPPNESIRFSTITQRPIIGQSIQETRQCLEWRRNKLGAMLGRLLPDDWRTRRS